MKNLLAAIIFLFFPLFILAQDISGIWYGTLVNDSMKRKQNFELGLSEYRGKITGYTYTTFIENDTFYYSIKRIKAERKDGFLVIEDVEMVGNNFPKRASKGVKQTTVFPLINDSTIDIANGKWSTNQTKKYYSIGGTAEISVQEEEKASSMLAHLQELKVKNTIAVKKTEKKDEGIAKNTLRNKDPQQTEATPVKKSPTNNATTSNNPVEVVQKPKLQEKQNKPEENKATVSISSKNEEVKKIEPVTGNEVAVNSNTRPKPIPGTDNKVIPKGPPVNNPATSKTMVVNKSTTLPPTEQKSITQNPEPPVVIVEEKAKPKIDNQAIIVPPVVQKKEAIGLQRALPEIVTTRKTESAQNIYFKNDSLVLALYDNGVVDGDTVSVFMNGEPLISKQKLKEAATKKTIYINPGMDSIQLVLFADNLGTIPPNTGLLTIRDGDEIYQVRFSADLQKNAMILLHRKK